MRTALEAPGRECSRYRFAASVEGPDESGTDEIRRTREDRERSKRRPPAKVPALDLTPFNFFDFPLGLGGLAEGGKGGILLIGDSKSRPEPSDRRLEALIQGR